MLYDAAMNTKNKSVNKDMKNTGLEMVGDRIFFIRGQKVMLDSDLAELYGVETKNLNKAIGRNPERFPADFMFQLSDIELKNLRFQFGTSSWGGRRTLPYAFTEHGIAMLSSVLRSSRAIEVNIFIIRAFIKLREMLATHKELAHKVDELERRQDTQGEHIGVIGDILKRLVQEPEKPSGKMGFIIE